MTYQKLQNTNMICTFNNIERENINVVHITIQQFWSQKFSIALSFSTIQI